eukprot:scaffold237739_cov40-Prasinocladus_malaysianus.AAC.1
MLAWDPDNLLVASEENRVVVYRPQAGDPNVTCLPLHSLDIGFVGVKGLAIPQDGRMIAAPSSHRLVVWSADPKLGLANTPTAQLQASRTVLNGHTGEIHALSFAASGSLLVSASRVDTRVRVWDTSAIIASQGTECTTCA